MSENKFVFELSGLNQSGQRIILSSSEIEKIKLSQWKELTFSIRDVGHKQLTAATQFTFFSKNMDEPKQFLCWSSEELVPATRFFRTFKQSPFRLLLFSSCSILEKNGLHSFLSGEGTNDKGVSHRKQIRQRIFSHKRDKLGYNSFVHKLGEFPRLSIPELKRILASNKPVPIRLLPPESVLRKVRANSYAALKLKHLGKAKYKAMRKARLARK